MEKKTLPASFFGIVLGLSGMGQAWRVAVPLWGMPRWIGECVLLLAALVWLALLFFYVIQVLRSPMQVRSEFQNPVQGSMPALLAVSTLLIALAVIPYSHSLAYILTAVGICWHLAFSLWHTGTMWKGGRDALDTSPALYLPTVAGNFTSAAALGALGHPDWGWLFMGAGFFSWLALESLVIQRILHPHMIPTKQRALLGIQFAPPVVCSMAWLVVSPGSSDHWLLMLWGYGLFQMLLGIRLTSWFGAQPFSPAYWAFTFGIASATVTGLKLALAGVYAAKILSIPVFIGGNLFICYLSVRTVYLMMTHRLLPQHSA